MPTKPTLVIFSQVYVPDPASVGQHLADVAVEMTRRGYRVRVYTADRGYDDPAARFPAYENDRGVEVRRLPFSSFGKRSILTRAAGTFSFMFQAMFRAMLTQNLAGILFSTSPPLIGFAAVVIHMFRSIPLVYWAMDLNPDQLIALGKLKRGDAAAQFLESANRMILRNADLVIALDRYMAARLVRRVRTRLDNKLVIIPPWPHEVADESLPHAENPFRARHGLHDRFVVMYSGNHSPSNPLRTFLEAIRAFADDDAVRFVFIGGGTGKKEVERFVEENALHNVLCLPYQPLGELRNSLSAADVHVVTMGEAMAGIIHPCKVYGAMSVSRPVLYFGPGRSHIADLLKQLAFGVQVRHGDVRGAIDAIRQLRGLSPSARDQMGAHARSVLAGNLSQSVLCGRLCDGLEIVFSQKHEPSFIHHVCLAASRRRHAAVNSSSVRIP